MSEKENLDITQSSGFPVSHVENPQVDPSVHPEQNQHVVNLSENQQIVPNEQIHYINNSSIQEYMTNESNFEIKPKIQGKINQPGFTINTIIFCLFHAYQIILITILSIYVAKAIKKVNDNGGVFFDFNMDQYRSMNQTALAAKNSSMFLILFLTSCTLGSLSKIKIFIKFCFQTLAEFKTRRKFYINCGIMIFLGVIQACAIYSLFGPFKNLFEKNFGSIDWSLLSGPYWQFLTNCLLNICVATYFITLTALHKNGDVATKWLSRTPY